MGITELRKREYLNFAFNMRISKNTKEQLEKLSEEYGLSTSYIVRTALSDWLEANDNNE